MSRKDKTAQPEPKSKRGLRLGGAAALLFGLALLIGLVAWVGFDPVLAAATSVGWLGFVLFCGYWLLVLAILGFAWFAGAIDLPLSYGWGFVWGRMVREGAADVLPFSQVGGLVLGAQTVIAQGVDEAKVFASTVIDLTTEMAAQIFYTLLGVCILGWALSGAGEGVKAVWIAGGAVLLTILATAGFVMLQRRGVSLLGVLAQRFFPDGVERSEATVRELTATYRRPAHLGVSFALHLVGWIGASVGSWFALKLMGAPLALSAVIAVEALMFTARSVGFAVPGALGVQEGAYLLAGPLMGLSAETAVALSLLKRARDLTLGVPTLIVWQILQSRRLLKA